MNVSSGKRSIVIKLKEMDFSLSAGTLNKGALKGKKQDILGKTQKKLCLCTTLLSLFRVLTLYLIKITFNSFENTVKGWQWWIKWKKAVNIIH